MKCALVNCAAFLDCACEMCAQVHHADGSHAVAVDLDDVADLGNVDKLVDEALTVHLGQDASLVVVPTKRTTALYVVVGP